jgi:hypothetical protein
MTVCHPPALLEVLHWPTPVSTPARAKKGLVVDTCLRRLLLRAHAAETAFIGEPTPERRRGREAYNFLLEVITGLRSQVPGETNVQGQFRRAWQDYCLRATTAQIAALAPVVETLLRDAAAIHRDHLQGIGGASYGSLLRKLLRPARGERLLFVGDGELAQSLLPYFERQQTAGWNYRLHARPTITFTQRFAPAEFSLAADWADHVVMTTPADPANDRLWQQQLDGNLLSTFTHLGRRRQQALKLSGATPCYDLDHLFELRARQANVRSLQIEHARVACREYAQLADCFESPTLQRARA